MIIAIRDDDVNFFTPAETLEGIYGALWTRGIPVSFGVTPFQRGERTAQVPPAEQLQERVFPVGENTRLVEILRRMAGKDLVEIMLHGVRHAGTDAAPEFAGREDLSAAVREAREYLQGLFGGEVSCFVPPHNELSAAGLRSVVSSGLDVIALPGFRVQLVAGSPRAYLRPRLFWQRRRLPYPYPLACGPRRQIGATTVYERAEAGRVLAALDVYRRIPESRVCLAFHWWELERAAHVREILAQVVAAVPADRFVPCSRLFE